MNGWMRAAGTRGPACARSADVALRSLALGVSGRADVVEFRGRPPRPVPVEYKRGKPKAHRADEVQLCAQAICLEEMFGHARASRARCSTAKPRRRSRVAFDADAARADRTSRAEPRAP